MGRHNKDGVPSTGNGRTGGVKPTKASSVVRRPSGSISWKATAAIFGVFKNKKQGKGK